MAGKKKENDVTVYPTWGVPTEEYNQREGAKSPSSSDAKKKKKK